MTNLWAVRDRVRGNPPKSFVAETEEGPGTVATEWIVEARAGGTCVVRVVHRWFADTDDWDGEFEGHAYGWATSFFPILRLYLTHFAGQPCSAFDLAAFSASPPAETWRTVKSALKVDDAARRVESMPDAPRSRAWWSPRSSRTRRCWALVRGHRS